MWKLLPEKLQDEYWNIIDSYCGHDIAEDPEEYFEKHASPELLSAWKEICKIYDEDQEDGVLL